MDPFRNALETLAAREWEKVGEVLHVSPKVEATCYPYQRQVLERMIAQRRVFCALTMGLGKTMISIGCLSHLHKSDSMSIVICPSYLINNWEHEFQTWWEGAQLHIIRNKKNFNGEWDTLKGKIILISYTMAAKFLKECPGQTFDNVVLDESHYMKSTKSLRFKHMHVQIRSSKNVFLLSGTPMPNRPEELFAQLHLLYPEFFSDYFKYCNWFCDGHIDEWNRYNARGSSNEEQLQEIMSQAAIRLRREEVLEQLPQCRRDMIYLTPDSIPKEFRSKFSTFEKLLKKADKEDVSFELKKIISELFRMTSFIKRRYVKSYLSDNVLGTNEKVILFAKHKHFIEFISEFLEENQTKHIWIDGSVNNDQRSQRIQQFLHEDDTQIAILSLGTCSTGLNLVPVSKMVFLELDWSPSILLQAECRINRIGAAPHLNYAYLVCENTLDSYIYKRIFNKAQNAEFIVDGGKVFDDLSIDESFVHQSETPSRA